MELIVRGDSRWSISQRSREDFSWKNVSNTIYLSKQDNSNGSQYDLMIEKGVTLKLLQKELLKYLKKSNK